MPDLGQPQTSLAPNPPGKYANRRAAAMRRVQSLPLHPFFFGMYPIVALAAANLGQMPLGDASRSLAIVLAASMALLLLLRLILRDGLRAAILSSLLLILFFSYGHVYQIVKTVQIGGVLLGRHRYLLPLWGLLLVAGVWAVRKGGRSLRQATIVLNIVSIAALALPCAAIVIDEMRQTRETEGAALAGLPLYQDSASGLAPNDFPDVYYIITDAYGRSDVLQEQFGYDNSDFIRYLQERGFYIAVQSQANYLWTHLSLSSSLNLDYLQTLDPGLAETGARLDVNRFVKHSLVRRRLEELGYFTVGFATGWNGSELFDADYVMTPGMSRAELLKQRRAFNDFEGVLVTSTAFQALLDLDRRTSTPVAAFVASRMKSRFTVQREIILGLFENLQRVPSTPGPKFVFAHIISPHGPYIFGPNGEPIDPAGAFSLAESDDLALDVSRRRYRDQATYVTRRLQETIEVILTESKRPVVIVLQSDHGPAMGLVVEDPDRDALLAKSAILNAYYVPEACRSRLYPSISPVNSFRVLFACLYGDGYQRIDDVTWWGYRRYVPLEEVLQGLALTGEGVEAVLATGR